MSVHSQYNDYIMLTQKLYRNGNSVAVTIPKEYLKELKLKVGAKVMVSKENGSLTISPSNKHLASDVDQKFAKMVDEFVNDHKDVLQKLANR